MDYENLTLHRPIKVLETCRKHQKGQSQYSDSLAHHIVLPQGHTDSWIRDVECPRLEAYSLSKVLVKAPITYRSSSPGRSVKWHCILYQ